LAINPNDLHNESHFENWLLPKVSEQASRQRVLPMEYFFNIKVNLLNNALFSVS